jgi:hypothetical protein
VVDSIQEVRRIAREERIGFSLKSEVNMKLFLSLIKQQIVKKYGEMEVGLHTFITLALDGCEQSASCPSHVCLT